MLEDRLSLLADRTGICAHLSTTLNLLGERSGISPPTKVCLFELELSMAMCKDGARGAGSTICTLLRGPCGGPRMVRDVRYVRELSAVLPIDDIETGRTRRCELELICERGRAAVI